jgi:hypothetical protein
MSPKKIPSGKKLGRPLLGAEPLTEKIFVRCTVRESAYLRLSSAAAGVATFSEFLRVHILLPYIKANPLPKGFEFNGGTKAGKK